MRTTKMKIITIFNFSNNYNYNKLCEWWLNQALTHSDLNIEIWYEDSLEHLKIDELKNNRVSIHKKEKRKIDDLLPRNLISDKAEHNVGFKLYNLCKEKEGFIFVDADAIILKNIEPLLKASKDKPVIMVNHQKIPTHTAHIPFSFLNSGMQVVSNPDVLNFDEIIRYQNMNDNFVCPGTDQAILFNYFVRIKYDYTHKDIGHEWNHCAGVPENLNKIAINHYWYNFKPWNLNCPLWADFLKKA